MSAKQAQSGAALLTRQQRERAGGRAPVAGSVLGCADQGPSILPPNVSRSSVSTCASPCTRTCIPAALNQETALPECVAACHQAGLWPGGTSDAQPRSAAPYQAGRVLRSRFLDNNIRGSAV